MKTLRKLWVASFLMLLSAGLHTRVEQCLVLSFPEFGNTRTCVENISLSSEHFIEVCEREGDEYVRFETTYVAKCPPMYKGVCRGLRTPNGQPSPYVSYRFESDMAFMKKLASMVAVLGWGVMARGLLS